VADDLRWGVYVTYQGSTDYVAQCFHEYGIHTDSSGHYAALYRDQHLIGLELGVSVASVALRNEPTGSPIAFLGDVAAIAKRNIKAGELLDGEGGYTVFGRLIPSQDSLAQKALPIGLANGAVASKDIQQGEMVRYEDVQLPDGRLTVRLRKELEIEFQRPVGSKSSGSEPR
jgi:predicted homoserine dehydrogenase-like protein